MRNVIITFYLKCKSFAAIYKTLLESFSMRNESLYTFCIGLIS